MTDALDDSQKTEQLFLDAALSNRRAELPFIGSCHWCKESVPSNSHFCDVDCRDDFQQHQRRQG